MCARTSSLDSPSDVSTSITTGRSVATDAAGLVERRQDQLAASCGRVLAGSGRTGRHPEPAPRPASRSSSRRTSNRALRRRRSPARTRRRAPTTRRRSSPRHPVIDRHVDPSGDQRPRAGTRTRARRVLVQRSVAEAACSRSFPPRARARRPRLEMPRGARGPSTQASRGEDSSTLPSAKSHVGCCVRASRASLRSPADRRNCATMMGSP